MSVEICAVQRVQLKRAAVLSRKVFCVASHPFQPAAETNEMKI
jgi:hypothetical protein